MSSPEPYRLSIDFGTSTTAAAYCRGDGEPVALRLSDRSDLMPSAVWIDKEGLILVGRTAINIAQLDPSAFEPSPKRLIGDEEAFLGGRVRGVTDLVTAVLLDVMTTARQLVHHEFDEVVLTHPDQWGRARRSVLEQAAQAAGIAPSQLRLVSEPQAAARYYTNRHQRDIPEGGLICVFDFGAGTLDVAVLQKQKDGGFAVRYSHGDNGLGGLNFDERIFDWVREQVLHSPDLLSAVEKPDNRFAFLDRIKQAKETLSSSPRTKILIPGRVGDEHGQVLLRREDFNDLIYRDVQAAVQLAKLTLSQAGAGDAPLVIYLTGGASSIPLVQSELAKLGRIERIGDPKTVVAQGALLMRATPSTPGSTPPRDAALQQAKTEIVRAPLASTLGSIIDMPVLEGASTGVVQRVCTAQGELVSEGDALFEVEAGGLMFTILAPVAGTVRDVNVGVHAAVTGGHPLGIIGSPYLPPSDFGKLPRLVASSRNDGGKQKKRWFSR